MFKTLIVLSAVLALAHSQQSADEMKAHLVSLGFSSEAVNGILSLGEKEHAKYAAVDKADPNYISKQEEIMKESKTELENYIKTQSAADQAVFEATMRKKTEGDKQ